MSYISSGTPFQVTYPIPYTTQARAKHRPVSDLDYTDRCVLRTSTILLLSAGLALAYAKAVHGIHTLKAAHSVVGRGLSLSLRLGSCDEF